MFKEISHPFCIQKLVYLFCQCCNSPDQVSLSFQKLNMEKAIRSQYRQPLIDRTAETVAQKYLSMKEKPSHNFGLQ